jgi:hypothetical protein
MISEMLGPKGDWRKDVYLQKITSFKFGTPLFAGWYPRTPSLPGTKDGPSPPLSDMWASVEDSRVPAPCYCSCRVGCRKSKSSACASSFVWNWEEMVRRHLKCWALPSMSSVWAVLGFSNGTRDLTYLTFPCPKPFPCLSTSRAIRREQ